jgi:uracil-DNA glycosylase
MFKNYEKFNEAKKQCNVCSIGKTYNKVVCSDGCNFNPKVMIIGEAAGMDEIKFGKWWVSFLFINNRPMIDCSSIGGCK